MFYFGVSNTPIVLIPILGIHELLLLTQSLSKNDKELWFKKNSIALFIHSLGPSEFQPLGCMEKDESLWFSPSWLPQYSGQTHRKCLHDSIKRHGWSLVAIKSQLMWSPTLGKWKSKLAEVRVASVYVEILELQTFLVLAHCQECNIKSNLTLQASGETLHSLVFKS